VPQALTRKSESSFKTYQPRNWLEEHRVMSGKYYVGGESSGSK